MGVLMTDILSMNEDVSGIGMFNYGAQKVLKKLRCLTVDGWCEGIRAGHL